MTARNPDDAAKPSGEKRRGANQGGAAAGSAAPSKPTAPEKPSAASDGGGGKQEGGQKTKGEVDLFWLEQVFPRPEDVFAYKSPGPETLAAEAVFGVDANVLLAPYQLGSESVTNLETIYRRLADASRLFAPAQAVREYGKNRARKVADVYAQVYNRLSSIPPVTALDCPMLEGIAEYATLKELGSGIKERAKEYKEKLTQLQQILADWGWNDKVSELYRAVFTPARIVQHDLSKDEIRADLTRRITHKLPPGYKDGGKIDEGVGDLIIWHSLIKLAKTTQRPVVFVCNEEKADWLVRSNDKPLMPRPELTHEFFQNTGKHFTMMSWPRFLKAMDASPDTVLEAELARMNDPGAYPTPEIRIAKILSVISSILRDFTGPWSGSIEDTSYGGDPYIDNDSFEPLIRTFQSAFTDYQRTAPEARGLRFLNEMVSLLGGILDDNLTLRFIHEADKSGDDNIRTRMINRCSRFEKVLGAFLGWLQLKPVLE